MSKVLKLVRTDRESEPFAIYIDDKLQHYQVFASRALTDTIDESNTGIFTETNVDTSVRFTKKLSDKCTLSVTVNFCSYPLHWDVNETISTMLITLKKRAVLVREAFEEELKAIRDAETPESRPKHFMFSNKEGYITI